ncbi:MAG: cupin [Bacteroidota bacterium]
MQPLIREYYIKDNGQFPNSPLPVLLYKRVLNLPAFCAARHVKKLFQKNDWGNNWQNGIYTFQHYHSITHEVFAAIKGQTVLLLGGENGKLIKFEKGDVIIIPAGVAHKNLGKEKDVICIGGYPEGKDFDINCGEQGERPGTDQNISNVPIPATDPVYGTDENGLLTVWRSLQVQL